MTSNVEQDAGAMRYPEIDMMKRTFDLIRNRLKIGDKLRPVIMSNPNTFLHFNGHRTTKSKYNATAMDTFKVGATADNKDGYIREPYLSKGHKALYEEAIEPLLQLFVNEPFRTAFEKLMEYDRYSVRDYMTTHLGYPNSVVRWIETMEWRTGWFDSSLTEIVLASLAFNDPRDKSEGKETAWYCFEFVLSFLAQLEYNPFLTAVALESWPTPFSPRSLPNQSITNA